MLQINRTSQNVALELYLIGVLAGDARGYDVPSRTWRAFWSLKVNKGVAPWSFPVKQTDVLDSMEGDTHRNLWEMKHSSKEKGWNSYVTFFLWYDSSSLSFT